MIAGSEAERLAGMRVSANFFAMLASAGARPDSPREDTPTSWQVVMLSDGVWPEVRRRSIGDRGGHHLEGLPFTIAGACRPRSSR